jgi:predicted dehydrogenase
VRIGIGLIGCGRHGARYAESLMTAEGAQLVAVCRRNQAEAQRFASLWGVRKAYTAYADLIKDGDVDAVIVTTPNSSHAEIGVEAAEHGKHVLVEKPIARSVVEAEGMISAARRNGVNLMVGHSFRYHPMTTESIRRLGDLGEVFLTVMCKRQQRAAGWRLDPQEHGGTVMDLGVHLFDLVRYLLKQEPTSALCRVRHVLGFGVEDSFAAILDMPGEGIAVIDANTSSNSRTDKMEFAGTEGHMMVDRYRREIQMVKGEERTRAPLLGSDVTLPLVLGDFVRSIAEGSEPPITGEDGLKAVRIAEACYRSAESNCRAAI